MITWLIAKAPLIGSAGRIGLFGIGVGFSFALVMMLIGAPYYNATFLWGSLFAIAAMNAVSPGPRNNKRLAWKSRPL